MTTLRLPPDWRWTLSIIEAILITVLWAGLGVYLVYSLQVRETQLRRLQQIEGFRVR